MKNNIFVPVSPCKDCDGHHTYCHVDCEKYQDYVKANNAYKTARRNYLAPYKQLIDMHEESRHKPKSKGR